MGVARAAAQTLGCIDQHRDYYRQVFPDVRSFEHLALPELLCQLQPKITSTPFTARLFRPKMS
jgi:hypothetical protein